MKFCFGDIVVVETNLIGVVVKSWSDIDGKGFEYDVYVRYFNEIRRYNEEVMQRYMVRHKYLSGEEIIYQDNAINNRNNPITTADNEHIELLMMNIRSLLQKYDCPDDVISQLVEVLENSNICLARDLICIKPTKLAMVLNDVLDVQYVIIVAIIFNICRDTTIQPIYTTDEYFKYGKKAKRKSLFKKIQR